MPGGRRGGGGRGARAGREQLLAEETERAVRERRLQCARELHDALSGTVGVIVAQAGAAEVQWVTRPEQARTALQVVTEAVDHARRDLVLMAPANPDRVPGLADIPALVERLRASGIAIRITDLPPAVADDGPGLSAKDAVGYGLTGLRERASLLGGTLVLDSSSDGLRVVARLPLPPSSSHCAPAAERRRAGLSGRDCVASTSGFQDYQLSRGARHRHIAVHRPLDPGSEIVRIQ